MEELSLQLKKSRLREDTDFAEVDKADLELKDYIKEKQAFYRFTLSTFDMTRPREDDEADSDDEETEVELKGSALDQASPELDGVLPDVCFILGRFGQAGIGLASEEVFELNVALRDLAAEFRLRKVRFWGKVLGLKNDVYVAEAPYQHNIAYEDFGWAEREEGAGEGEKNEKSIEENEESAEDTDEKGETENETENVEQDSLEEETPKELPMPKKKSQEKIVPPEAEGTGVNECVYFACTKLGQPWRVLPFMTPQHIVEARYLKRFLTGDMESQIRGCVPYPGREAHYLRAQIARITASTYIAPADFYKLTGGEDSDEEQDEDEGEGSKGGDMVTNAAYVPKSTMCLYSEGVKAWVHYRRAILDQGRCVPMESPKEADASEEEENDEPEEEAETVEEEQSEALEDVAETQLPLLRNLSEDKGTGRVKPWRMKLSSRVVPETAILILQSNIWPGAYTFYDGKTFEHIYIGHACKFSVVNYAPPTQPECQTEYPVADDVIEHTDKEITQNEAEDENVDQTDDGNTEEDNVEEKGPAEDE